MLIPTFEEFIINDMLFELSQNSTLYHRSSKKLKIGDKIFPKLKKGSHWLELKSMEIALEYLRQKEYSNRPSRFSCIYASVIPRSRFIDKGYLYAIKPVGNLFMTDSRLIDKLGESFDRNMYDRYNDFEEHKELIKKAKEGDINALEELRYMLPYDANLYWKGTQKAPIKDLEILCESAIVTEEIEENTKRLKINQTVKITEEKLYANLTLFFNSKNNAKESFTEEQIQKLVEEIRTTVFSDDVKIEDKEYSRKEKDKHGNQSAVIEFSGILKKGAKLKITYVQSGLTNSTITNWDNEHVKRYSSVMFDFYIGKKLYQRKDKAPLFRFDLNSYRNEKIWDVSKYMKF